jgi:predicted phosphodiesterase
MARLTARRRRPGCPRGADAPVDRAIANGPVVHAAPTAEVGAAARHVLPSYCRPEPSVRILVISDIHANLPALEAVLEDGAPFEAVWCLGDAVGYGPDPEAVVVRLADLAPEVWLAGNHDHAAVGLLDLDTFNADARQAVLWTARELGDDARDRLFALEASARLDDRGITLVHGSPRHPLWEYITSPAMATDNFACIGTPLCFFGHTHVPAVYQEEVDGAVRCTIDAERPMSPSGARWLVNPGSVGQPRDGDPRASYVVFDPEAATLAFRRVAYDIAAVQSRMLAAHLPSRLATRLDSGM